MRCSSVKSPRPLPTSLAHARTVSITETHRSGDYVKAFSVPLVTCGESQYQAVAIIGDEVVGMVAYTHEAGKPIVIEKLDFRRKKVALDVQSPRYSRMLSTFSYGKIKAYFLSRTLREGVEVFRVNPAFSSVISRVEFMERYGLSVHQATPLVVGRRLLSCSELIPCRWMCPLGSGAQVTFAVPVRK